MAKFYPDSARNKDNKVQMRPQHWPGNDRPDKSSYVKESMRPAFAQEGAKRNTDDLDAKAVEKVERQAAIFWAKLQDKKYDPLEHSHPNPLDLIDLDMAEIKDRIYNLGFFEWDWMPDKKSTTQAILKDIEADTEEWDVYGDRIAHRSERYLYDDSRKVKYVAKRNLQESYTEWNPAYPSIKEWFDSIPEVIFPLTIDLMKLESGGTIYPHAHTDMSKYLNSNSPFYGVHPKNPRWSPFPGKGFDLFNVCINWNEGCTFATDPHGLLEYADGKTYWLNTSYSHSVQNFGDEARYHLVITCGFWRERMKRLFLHRYTHAYNQWHGTDIEMPYPTADMPYPQGKDWTNAETPT